jgi:hypothetical protein
VPRAVLAIDAAVAIKCFGVATSYLIVVGDQMPGIVNPRGTYCIAYLAQYPIPQSPYPPQLVASQTVAQIKPTYNHTSYNFKRHVCDNLKFNSIET